MTEKLHALVKLAEKATEGPWEVVNCTDLFTVGRGDDPSDGHQIADCQVDYDNLTAPSLDYEAQKANTIFIAAARNAIPDLIALLAERESTRACELCGDEGEPPPRPTVWV